jgi:hypothetical protein
MFQGVINSLLVKRALIKICEACFIPATMGNIECSHDVFVSKESAAINEFLAHRSWTKSNTDNHSIFGIMLLN